MRKANKPNTYTFLYVKSVEVLNGLQDYQYKKFEFEEILVLDNEIIFTGVTTHRNFYPKREVQILEDSKLKSVIWEGDFLYNKIVVGSLVPGKLFKFKTKPYSIEKYGKKLETFSCVIFENEYLISEKVAAEQLAYYNTYLVDEDENEIMGYRKLIEYDSDPHGPFYEECYPFPRPMPIQIDEKDRADDLPF